MRMPLAAPPHPSAASDLTFRKGYSLAGRISSVIEGGRSH
jgi:hypothetical protein